MTPDRIEPFSPAALVAHVQSRMPTRKVAERFGISARQLTIALKQLRSEDPDFPVRGRRRHRRWIAHLEPAGPGGEPSKRCAGPCGRWLPLSQFKNVAPKGRAAYCRECCGATLR